MPSAFGEHVLGAYVQRDGRTQRGARRGALAPVKRATYAVPDRVNLVRAPHPVCQENNDQYRSSLEHGKQTRMHLNLFSPEIVRPRQLAWCMAAIFATFAATVSAFTSLPTTCTPGVYRQSDDAFLVLGPIRTGSNTGQRYYFDDGRRGRLGDEGGQVTCANDVATVRLSATLIEQWAREATRETEVTFESAATQLAGQLIEPEGEDESDRPLVVFVHGSERTPAIGGIYPYVLAAQGISVFAYDKRGTGASGGQFTMNFELLAADASQALATARTLAEGRFGRAGFFGGSQGGWVAPLAATQSDADFVAVGFGLVISPIDEDRAQLFDEAEAMNLDDEAIDQLERLADATATLLRTDFTEGFAELAEVKKDIGDVQWAATIRGEYSGEMLRMDQAELERIGEPRFDSVELIWDYDAKPVLAKLKVPLLWILADEDREAPVDDTIAVIQELTKQGKNIESYIFPNTDHGMLEFETLSDGRRRYTRIADGYFELLGDWIKGQAVGPYGASRRLQGDT